MIGKLEYCGGGQIRDAETKQLVSPREIVQAWNEVRASNAAAMREALESVQKSRRGCYPIQGVLDPLTIHLVEKALAVPPRNCDVGTADEQGRRCERFCMKHKAFGCDKCPLVHVQSCELAWAQMPYAEEVGVK